MQIIKRTGEYEEFNAKKIENAIAKAMLEGKGIDVEIIDKVVSNIIKTLDGVKATEVTVELIQDLVETELMNLAPNVAKRYILYREERTKARTKGWDMDELQQSIWDKKYQYENESFEEWLERVSGGNPRIKKRIRDKEFLFGGRILSNRGLQKYGRKVTYSNCYVLSAPKDNLEDIFETAKKMARTYSYGGGCGTSLRHLRPRNAEVHNNAKTTSGAVSFMPIFSLTTETIGQNGRRGALMLSIPSHHPDLEEFIDVKTENGAITGANISIEIDDAFMLAVRDNKEYRLHFEVEDTGQVIEKMINARVFYKKIIANNWDWAEPGMLYWDRINGFHLMSEDPEFEYDGTNPCAEEPLPPGGSCLLGSINLAEFVVAPFTENATFDVPRFKEAVHDAIVALNEVLDEGLPLHPLEEQRISVRELRQIGLGVMGISEMLIKMGITYGGTKSLMLCDMIGDLMVNQALQSSALIAKELGTFDRYNWEYIKNSEFFMQNASKETYDLVEQYGLRNSQVLTIAPTGSISTMIGVSGGIEPIFALEFERTTKSLHGTDVKYKVHAGIVNEYLQANGLPEHAPLPEFFITSRNLNWRNRIEMQAVWQSHIDASISSTVNLPQEITVEEIEDIYMYAWEMGLKGCTIYRSGCKRGGILTVEEDEDQSEESAEKEVATTVEMKRATGYYATCPECKSENMMVANGCVECQDCGFSPC